MDPVFSWLMQFFLAMVFLTAAWHKLREREAFARVLNNYGLTPGSANPVLVWLLALNEIACAGLLLAHSATGAVYAASLLFTYALIMGIMLLQGKRDMDCGCSGPARKQGLSAALLWRNAALIGIALLLLLPTNERALTWLDGVQLLLAGVSASLLYLASEHLLANQALFHSDNVMQEAGWKLHS